MKLSAEELKIVNTDIKDAVKKACTDNGVTDPEAVANIEEAARKIFLDDTPIFKALGISDELMENGYALGYDLYKIGKFKDAVVVFLCLLRTDGLNARYFYSIGACYHQMKQYEEASTYYQTAAYLDPENPIPCYHMYDCFNLLDDLESAAMALQMVILRTENEPKYQKFYYKAKTNLDSLIETIKAKRMNKK